MPTGTWCDGLEGFLAGNEKQWPAYMNDDTGQSVIVVPGDGLDRSSLKERDRIYFMAPSTTETGVLPDWAVKEIMKALSEERRVRIYGPTMADVAALCDIVGYPLAGWAEMGRDAPSLPN